MNALAILLSWLGAALALELVGLLAHGLGVLGAALLLVVAVLVDPACDRLGERARRAPLGALLAASGLLLLPVPVELRGFALAAWFWGLSRLTDRGPSPAFAVGLLLAGAVRLAYDRSLLVWYGVHGASLGWSETVGTAVGPASALGPTYSGIHAVLLAVALVLGAAATTSRRAPAILGALLATALVWTGWLALVAAAPRLGAPTLLAALTPHAWPVLGTLLVGLPALWCLHRGRDASRREAAPARARLVLASLAALAGLGLLVHRAPAPSNEPRRVALYEKGLLNWMTPDRSRFGTRSVGMFGLMPRMIENLGWESELLERLDTATLADRDVLVMINQMTALPDEELAAVHAFVEDGGGLLVLGDHTFWKSERRVIPNDALEPSHVRLRFDSADAFVGGWLHSLDFPSHPLTAGLADDTTEAGSVVGASLEIGYPARPLVVGRYGYSDRGRPDQEARGYLDDLEYDVGERLGDVVLVAAEDVGRGRVVAFGDTTSFANLIQVYTWQFVRRVFTWLGDGGQAAHGPLRDAAGALLLLLGAGAALASQGRAVAVPTLALVLGAGGAGAAWVERDLDPPRALEGPVVVHDLAHVNLHAIEGSRDTSIAGLYTNELRRGLFPVVDRTFDRDQIRQSRAYVTIAPSRRFDAAELAFLEEYMHEGGTVVACAGWEERRGVEPLLAGAGLRLVPKPLGRTEAALPGTPLRPFFWSAWPVHGDAETLVSLDGEPVVVEKTVGAGRLVVIGDSRFLTDRNLENKDGAVLQNVQFFNWLYDRIANGGAS